VTSVNAPVPCFFSSRQPYSVLFSLCSEIQDTLKRLEESFERWETAIRTSDTIGIVTQADTTNNNVGEIEEMLLDVEETIRSSIYSKVSCIDTYYRAGIHIAFVCAEIVEQDRARFNIDDVEINSRKNFVTSTKKRVDTIKNELRKETESRKARFANFCVGLRGCVF
jgi:hypothetical protein